MQQGGQLSSHLHTLTSWSHRYCQTRFIKKYPISLGGHAARRQTRLFASCQSIWAALESLSSVERSACFDILMMKHITQDNRAYGQISKCHAETPRRVSLWPIPGIAVYPRLTIDWWTDETKPMSFIFSLVLIAIAWILSAFINDMLEFWYLFDRLPWWVIGIGITSAIAWFVSEPWDCDEPIRC